MGGRPGATVALSAAVPADVPGEVDSLRPARSAEAGRSALCRWPAGRRDSSPRWKPRVRAAPHPIESPRQGATEGLFRPYRGLQAIWSCIPGVSTPGWNPAPSGRTPRPQPRQGRQKEARDKGAGNGCGASRSAAARDGRRSRRCVRGRLPVLLVPWRRSQEGSKWERVMNPPNDGLARTPRCCRSSPGMSARRAKGRAANPYLRRPSTPPPHERVARPREQRSRRTSNCSTLLAESGGEISAPSPFCAFSFSEGGREAHRQLSLITPSEPEEINTQIHQPLPHLGVV